MLKPFGSGILGVTVPFKADNVSKAGNDGPDIEELETWTRDYKHIRHSFEASFLYPREKCSFQLESISKICTPEIKSRFSMWQNDVLINGGSDVDTDEHLCCTTETHVSDIARYGPACKPGGGKNTHGNRKLGVYVFRHADIALASALTQEHPLTLYVVLYKFVYGKVNTVVINNFSRDPNYHLPSADYHCNVSAIKPSPHFEMIVNISHDQVYLYDVVDGQPLRYPRQILPFAVVKMVDKEHFISMARPLFSCTQEEKKVQYENFSVTRVVRHRHLTRVTLPLGNTVSTDLQAKLKEFYANRQKLTQRFVDVETSALTECTMNLKATFRSVNDDCVRDVTLKTSDQANETGNASQKEKPPSHETVIEKKTPSKAPPIGSFFPNKETEATSATKSMSKDMTRIITEEKSTAKKRCLGDTSIGKDDSQEIKLRKVVHSADDVKQMNEVTEKTQTTIESKICEDVILTSKNNTVILKADENMNTVNIMHEKPAIGKVSVHSRKIQFDDSYRPAATGTEPEAFEDVVGDTTESHLKPRQVANKEPERMTDKPARPGYAALSDSLSSPVFAADHIPSLTTLALTLTKASAVVTVSDNSAPASPERGPACAAASLGSPNTVLTPSVQEVSVASASTMNDTSVCQVTQSAKEHNGQRIANSPLINADRSDCTGIPKILVGKASPPASLNANQKAGKIGQTPAIRSTDNTETNTSSQNVYKHTQNEQINQGDTAKKTPQIGRASNTELEEGEILLTDSDVEVAMVNKKAGSKKGDRVSSPILIDEDEEETAQRPMEKQEKRLVASTIGQRVSVSGKRTGPSRWDSADRTRVANKTSLMQQQCKMTLDRLSTSLKLKDLINSGTSVSIVKPSGGKPQPGVHIKEGRSLVSTAITTVQIPDTDTETEPTMASHIHSHQPNPNIGKDPSKLSTENARSSKEGDVSFPIVISSNSPKSAESTARDVSFVSATGVPASPSTGQMVQLQNRTVSGSAVPSPLVRNAQNMETRLIVISPIGPNSAIISPMPARPAAELRAVSPPEVSNEPSTSESQEIPILPDLRQAIVIQPTSSGDEESPISRVLRNKDQSSSELAKQSDAQKEMENVRITRDRNETSLPSAPLIGSQPMNIADNALLGERIDNGNITQQKGQNKLPLQGRCEQSLVDRELENPTTENQIVVVSTKGSKQTIRNQPKIGTSPLRVRIDDSSPTPLTNEYVPLLSQPTRELLSVPAQPAASVLTAPHPPSEPPPLPPPLPPAQPPRLLDLPLIPPSQVQMSAAQSYNYPPSLMGSYVNATPHMPPAGGIVPSLSYQPSYLPPPHQPQFYPNHPPIRPFLQSYLQQAAPRYLAPPMAGLPTDSRMCGLSPPFLQAAIPPPAQPAVSATLQYTAVQPQIQHAASNQRFLAPANNISPRSIEWTSPYYPENQVTVDQRLDALLAAPPSVNNEALDRAKYGDAPIQQSSPMAQTPDANQQPASSRPGTSQPDINITGVGNLKDINKLVRTLQESVGTAGEAVESGIDLSNAEGALDIAVKGLGHVIQNLECMRASNAEASPEDSSQTAEDDSHGRTQDRFGFVSPTRRGPHTPSDIAKDSPRTIGNLSYDNQVSPYISSPAGSKRSHNLSASMDKDLSVSSREESTRNVIKERPPQKTDSKMDQQSDAIQTESVKSERDNARNKKPFDVKTAFHGRTLLKGRSIPSRRIPLEPLYIDRPVKLSGKLETIPLDPRPPEYRRLREMLSVRLRLKVCYMDGVEWGRAHGWQGNNDKSNMARVLGNTDFGSGNFGIERQGSAANSKPTDPHGRQNNESRESEACRLPPIQGIKKIINQESDDVDAMLDQMLEQTVGEKSSAKYLSGFENKANQNKLQSSEVTMNNSVVKDNVRKQDLPDIDKMVDDMLEQTLTNIDGEKSQFISLNLKPKKKHDIRKGPTTTSNNASKFTQDSKNNQANAVKRASAVDSFDMLDEFYEQSLGRSEGESGRRRAGEGQALFGTVYERHLTPTGNREDARTDEEGEADARSVDWSGDKLTVGICVVVDNAASYADSEAALSDVICEGTVLRSDRKGTTERPVLLMPPHSPPTWAANPPSSVESGEIVSPVGKRLLDVEDINQLDRRMVITCNDGGADVARATQGKAKKKKKKRSHSGSKNHRSRSDEKTNIGDEIHHSKHAKPEKQKHSVPSYEASTVMSQITKKILVQKHALKKKDFISPIRAPEREKKSMKASVFGRLSSEGVRSRLSPSETSGSERSRSPSMVSSRESSASRPVSPVSMCSESSRSSYPRHPAQRTQRNRGRSPGLASVYSETSLHHAYASPSQLRPPSPPSIRGRSPGECSRSSSPIASRGNQKNTEYETERRHFAEISGSQQGHSPDRWKQLYRNASPPRWHHSVRSTDPHYESHRSRASYHHGRYRSPSPPVHRRRYSPSPIKFRDRESWKTEGGNAKSRSSYMDDSSRDSLGLHVRRNRAVSPTDSVKSVSSDRSVRCRDQIYDFHSRVPHRTSITQPACFTADSKSFRATSSSSVPSSLGHVFDLKVVREIPLPKGASSNLVRETPLSQEAFRSVSQPVRGSSHGHYAQWSSRFQNRSNATGGFDNRSEREIVRYDDDLY